MEEKNRAKAINAKFDKDIKAAAVGYEAQISVLNAQRDECWAFNTACIESRREFWKLISPSRGPLVGRRQNPTVLATKKRKAAEIALHLLQNVSLTALLHVNKKSLRIERS